MGRFPVVVLSAVITIAATAPLEAQVNRPGRTLAERLPQPATATASQLPDGRIQVVWSAVDGARSYKLIRSVPPSGARAVSLPNPSDTQYVDTDVQAGSTYYYVVSAINEDGIEGLKKGIQSVKAVTASTPMRDAGDPEVPTETGTTDAPVAAPTDVVAKPFPYMQPTITWKSANPGVRFLVERVRIRDSKAAWEQIIGLYDMDRLWSCCEAKDREPPPNVDLVYRVTAVEPATNRRSQPVLSDTINNWTIKTSGPTLGALSLVEGETKQVGPNNSTWMALDTFVVRVWGNGLVTGKQCCRTYVIGSQFLNGEVLTAIWRVDVQPKR